jgi:hypothetical protein
VRLAPLRVASERFSAVRDKPLDSVVFHFMDHMNRALDVVGFELRLANSVSGVPFLVFVNKSADDLLPSFTNLTRDESDMAKKVFAIMARDDGAISMSEAVDQGGSSAAASRDFVERLMDEGYLEDLGDGRLTAGPRARGEIPDALSANAPTVASSARREGAASPDWARTDPLRYDEPVRQANHDEEEDGEEEDEVAATGRRRAKRVKR